LRKVCDERIQKAQQIARFSVRKARFYDVCRPSLFPAEASLIDSGLMALFLRAHERKKNGKTYTYWSITESVRTASNKVVQRHVLYLGSLTPVQEGSWSQTLHHFDPPAVSHPELPGLALAWSKTLTPAQASAIGVRLNEFRLERPRQWGACWVALKMWHLLRLSEFWTPLLPPSREGTQWLHVLITLVSYRLIDPGSEWRLHRQWFENSAVADLLDEDYSLAAKDTLYRCLDRLLKHRDALFVHLQERWKDEFKASFDVLLYDLTSTYFESDPPFPEGGKRRFGYSRDKRPDCVQVIIALVVTPEGYPLAYEVLPGNTADKSTLRMFLSRIESLYGKAQRTWIMDRGIPTEAVLEELQAPDSQVNYLVGTPKGRLTKLESDLLQLPWQVVRTSVRVKLLPQEKEIYVYVESQDRLLKERAMRLRKLKVLIKRLRGLQQAKNPITRDNLLIKLGGAKEEAGRVYRLLKIEIPESLQDVRTFTFKLDRGKYRQWRRREGRYLLRTNLTTADPGKLWEQYLLLTEIEAAFKSLKDDLCIRPVYHQKQERIEAHIFVAYLAYCLQVTLKGKLKQVAGGLTPRAVLEKFASIQMMNVVLPTQEQGKELVFRRYTHPEKDHLMLLAQLNWDLPDQAPPTITSDGKLLDLPAPA
jgi:transposase